MLSANCARFAQYFLSFTQQTGLVSLRALSSSSSLAFRSRQRGRNTERPSVNRHWLTEEDAEHFEALEDFINQDGLQGHGFQLQTRTEDLIHRQFRQQQIKVKRKVVERKFFKQPQEVNLLTWSAKQQIRYLHEQFPDEWTPERLAESFPVSQEGVLRLLKSSYTPRSEQEIAKHDRRVVAHWRQLKEALALEGSPAEEKQTNQFQHIVDAGKLPLMINAGGAAQLPAPRPDRQNWPRGQNKMGLFESIVAGSQVMKAQEEGEQKQTEEQKAAGVRLLKDIAEFRQRKRKAIPAYFPEQSGHQR